MQHAKKEKYTDLYGRSTAAPFPGYDQVRLSVRLHRHAVTFSLIP